MSQRLSALASAIGLAVACAGCGPAILARYDAVALADPAERSFPSGSSRQAIDAQLGKPQASRPLPDGSRADTYTYILRNPEWAAMKWAMAVGSVITVGFTEPLWVPWASYDVFKHRRTVTFRYDPDDVVLDHAPFVPYGPNDDSLPPPSFDAIRGRCRVEDAAAGTPSETSGAPGHRTYNYSACVAKRLAIWGTE
jgi:hypothetical protein